MATYSFIHGKRLIGLERDSIELVNRGESSFKADLEAVWEGVQADRTAMLAQVRELQLATQLLLAAEAGRIAAFAPDDDRVVALAESGRMLLDRVTMLDQEIEVATIRVPMVKKTEALLHGRITDDAHRAVGPVTVTLADENGKPVRGVAPVQTDSAGYYALVVPAGAAAEITPDRELALWLANGSERVAAGGEPVKLGAGSIELRDVALDAAMLDRLKLRPAAPPPATRGGEPTAGRRGSTLRPTKKRKAG
jgi:hypothetical protein